MSDTPRTDAWKWSGGDDPIGEFYKFACQLERELTAMTAYAERLEKRGDQMTPDTTGDMKEAWELTKETKP